MKILLVNWQDIKNPLSGGAEVHMHEIFSRVARLGHDVTLFCSSFDGAPAEENVGGIRVIREGGRFLFNFLVPIRYMARFRHEGYDVVIDDMNKIPFFTPLFVREPLAVIIHHLFDRTIFEEASRPIALYVYLLERQAVALLRRRRTHLLVVSRSTRDELIAKGIREADISIVPNCVDHDVHHPGGVARSRTPLIGYFGRLKKYKSVDHLIRAFAIARTRVTGLRLIIIGEGDYRPALERLGNDLGVADEIRFTGFVEVSEKVRLLQEIWFLVNTSAKEGWGLTVIEANACGTTVIASDVPGLRDAVKDGETGLLYDYGNVQELADTIVLLAGNEALRERLAAAARQWSGDFDWQKVAEQTVDLLHKQISRNHERAPRAPVS